MKNIIKLSAVLAIALAVAGCAEKESTPYSEIEQESLDAWMKTYNPQAERTDEGIYIEWLREQDETADKPVIGDWIMLNYRGTTLDGTAFMSRYEDEARKLGTFTYYTHYTPYYINYTASALSILSAAELVALDKMRKGDSVRVYMPSHYSEPMAAADYSSSYYGYTDVRMQYGYAGETSRPTNRPAIVELVLKDVIRNEDTYEMNQVKAVSSGWGVGEFDTIRRGFYMQIIEEDATAPKINQDSTAKIRYVGRFLDGFLFETNVDTVLQRERNDYSTTPTVKTYTKYSDESTLTTDDKPYYYMLKNGDLRYNSLVRIVYTSEWRYASAGNSGGSSTSPVLFPYTPLVYDVRIMEYEEPEEDD